jgi:hypothetical protein
MTLMPVVHVIYDFLYAEVLGPVEKRLNQVLRGRPATEPAVAADQVNAEQGGDAPAEQNGEQRGIARTALAWLGRLLRGPLVHGDEDQENQEAEIEVEIQINLEDAGEEAEGDNVDADAGADDLIEAIQGEFQMIPEPEEPAQPQEQQPLNPERKGGQGCNDEFEKTGAQTTGARRTGVRRRRIIGKTGLSKSRASPSFLLL